MRGRAGERVTACLEIRTIADIGLVGAPNAGKSSLLKLLSSADPKVSSALQSSDSLLKPLHWTCKNSFHG